MNHKLAAVFPDIVLDKLPNLTQRKTPLEVISVFEREEPKIKVLYLIDRLIGFAGTEKHLFQLIRHFDKSIYCFEIIQFGTPPSGNSGSGIDASEQRTDQGKMDWIDEGSYPSLLHQFARQGVQIKTLPVERMYSPKGLIKFFKLVFIIREINPDIVQTFHFISDTYGVLASKVAGVRHIVSSRRDMADYKKKRQILINLLCNRFIDRYIAVCEAVGDRIQKLESIPKRKIDVVYNGLDFEEYTSHIQMKREVRNRLGIEDSAFVVGIACIFRPEKGLDIFFRALSELKSRIKDLRIIAIGDGEIRPDVESLCNRLSLNSITTFTGYVRDIREYVPAMDIVCLTPNINEGLSNAIIEEMAMGIPIVATNVGGNAELILDNVTGMIVQPGDSDAIAQAILELYNKPMIRESMGRRGMERIRDNFSVERMIMKTQSIYRSVLENTYEKGTYEKREY